MKYDMEESAKLIWENEENQVNTEKFEEMAYELFEHLMDIRNNYLDGYDIGKLIKEFEGNSKEK